MYVHLYEFEKLLSLALLRHETSKKFIPISYTPVEETFRSAKRTKEGRKERKERRKKLFFFKRTEVFINDIIETSWFAYQARSERGGK